MAEIQGLRLSHLLIKPGISRWLYIVPTEHRRKFVQHGIGQLTKPGFICAKFLSHFGQDIAAIMREEKAQTRDTGKVTLPAKEIEQFFPKSYTPEQKKKVIVKLLASWARQRGEKER